MSYNGVEPSNREEAKVWNFFNDSNRWDWYPIRIWPAFLAKAAMSGVLRNHDRFGLFLYFVVNGLSPQDAVDTIASLTRLDTEANRQLAWLVEHVDDVVKTYKTYDEELGKWH